MTQEYLSKKIKAIEEALNFVNNELIRLLHDNEVEKIRSQIVKREDILVDLNERNLILLATDDNPEKLDALIMFVRKSKNHDDLIINLMEQYSLSSVQAETIAGTTLHKLTDTDQKAKKSMCLEELSSIEKELNENLLYTTLEEKDIAFLIKSLELKISLLDFFS